MGGTHPSFAPLTPQGRCSWSCGRALRRGLCYCFRPPLLGAVRRLRAPPPGTRPLLKPALGVLSFFFFFDVMCLHCVWPPVAHCHLEYDPDCRRVGPQSHLHRPLPWLSALELGSCACPLPSMVLWTNDVWKEALSPDSFPTPSFMFLKQASGGLT